MTRPRHLWVKICGTTTLQDARLCVDAGADALGFIFASSVRRVEVEDAANIVAAVGGEAECVGVFVNDAPERVAAVADRVGLSGVQLHGDEPPSGLREYRRHLGARKIVKALRAGELVEDPDGLVAEYLDQRECFDAILLDSGSARQRGGTGVPFDWDAAAEVAAQIREHMPLIIAGGLTAENVIQAIELFEPWGLDVVSGVESTPGQKDAMKVQGLLAAIRQHVTIGQGNHGRDQQ